MRQAQSNRRGRGRSRNNKAQNPLTKNYESNGPDVKIRGTAAHISEKYNSLARDALTSSDIVRHENYLQHAEHYNRIIMTAQENNQAEAANAQNSDEGNDNQNNNAANGEQNNNNNAQKKRNPRRRRPDERAQKQNANGDRNGPNEKNGAGDGHPAQSKTNGRDGPVVQPIDAKAGDAKVVDTKAGDPKINEAEISKIETKTDDAAA